MYSIYTNPSNRDALVKLLDLLNTTDIRILTAYMDGYEHGRLDGIVKELAELKDKKPSTESSVIE